MMGMVVIDDSSPKILVKRYRYERTVKATRPTCRTGASK